jgi:hypothetical protein
MAELLPVKAEYLLRIRIERCPNPQAGAEVFLKGSALQGPQHGYLVTEPAQDGLQELKQMARETA